MNTKTHMKRIAETTIGLTHKTKSKLAKLKIHPRESFEDVIKRLIKEGK